MRGTTLVRLGTILALAVAAACAAPTATPPEEHSDAVPGDQVSGDDMAETFTLEGGFLVSPPLEAPEGATRAALLIDFRLERVDAELSLEARGLVGGEPGEWVPAEIVWREAPYAVARADLGFLADGIEVRLPEEQMEALQALRWEAVLPDEDVDDGAPALVSPGEEQQGLASDLANVGVKPRSAWGARGTRCTSGNASKSRIAVHHTVTPPTYQGTHEARLRQIQAFHMDGRGYCDVAYHFLVSTDGRLWEGRPVHLLGAHVGGHNTGNVGVSFVGCFHSSQCGSMGPNVPPEAMVQGGAKLIRRLADRHGIPRTADRIKGHRDHSGQSTSCPGSHLHARLGDLRSYTPPAPPPPPPFAGCADVARVAGSTRYATAALLSKRLFPNGASVVVLATGADDNPDALVAGPLARKLGGPVLLVGGGSLPAETKAEIQRLGATEALLIGGTGAVPATVGSELSGLGLSVERIAGPTRFATAALVARRVGSPTGVAFVASGDSANLVDGLAAGSAAAVLKVPLLLVHKGSVPPETTSALAELGVTKTYLAGGAGAVTSLVQAALPNAVRLWGADRYATAAALSNTARALGANTTRVSVARGDRTPDAVAAAASGRLLLLSGTGALPAVSRDFLKTHAQKATLMGGLGALSGDVEREACAALQ